MQTANLFWNVIIDHLAHREEVGLGCLAAFGGVGFCGEVVLVIIR